MSTHSTPSAGRQFDVFSALACGDQAAAHNLMLNSPFLDWHTILAHVYCPSLVPPHRETGGAVPGLSVAPVRSTGIVAMTTKRQGRKAA